MIMRMQRLSSIATLTLTSFVLGYTTPSGAQPPPGPKPTATPQAHPPPPPPKGDSPPQQQGDSPPSPSVNQQGDPPSQQGHPPPRQGYPQQPYNPQYTYPPAYQQPQVPVRYVLQPRWGLVTDGISVLTSTYFITAFVGAGVAVGYCVTAPWSINCRTGLWPLYIPVIGPFIQTGYVYGTPAAVVAGRALLIVDGLIQAGGLAMIIVGATTKRRIPIYSDHLQVSPYASYTGGGLVATGRF